VHRGRLARRGGVGLAEPPDHQRGLDWRRIAILRAYRKYRQRIGSRFTESYQNDVIAANPHITAKLIRLFELRNDPAIERNEEAEAALREDILVDLEAVPSLDHDRILRNQLGLIEATVRTNAYRTGGARSPSSCPRPMCRRSRSRRRCSRSTSTRPRSRGSTCAAARSPAAAALVGPHGLPHRGLRAHARADDQERGHRARRRQGRLLLRQRPEDPAALKAEVERGYVTFISGLLDLTDNLVEGEVVHPDGVRVLDDDDTYLVVAADKGTATFSDTANRVAGRYGFWLGDAFASGGSKGYDHKALGITARGAWESLKRHFRELDMDPAVDEFTAVGIGDMSGDVFGNGML
jgi:glutamate dehydrogenase